MTQTQQPAGSEVTLN